MYVFDSKRLEGCFFSRIMCRIQKCKSNNNLCKNLLHKLAMNMGASITWFSRFSITVSILVDVHAQIDVHPLLDVIVMSSDIILGCQYGRENRWAIMGESSICNRKASKMHKTNLLYRPDSIWTVMLRIRHGKSSNIYAITAKKTCQNHVV